MVPKKALTAIVGSAFLALLTVGLMHCSSYLAVPPIPGTSMTFTSTSVNSHAHSVTIDKTVVLTPPPGGISETTASTSAHKHSITLTQDQLATINSGGLATVKSGISDFGGAHTHDFTITKWF